ncbi:DUF309 domain-containing protein [Natranaeroarchaeum sulfidigenes]|uniref:Putative metal-dependent hydrolase n=1 Tax=Natranaeroarchaeum sulfidigenes TaxID=2784880 RepID=A0A897MTU4_9EURY|nr:DUF309 domain-containing protein [Natranaeroarchaeum sulfidigenes]QSG03932.1 putative metal-dependent hydrolase [Natranaeroarchaeum sulfidigenes]
MDAELRAGVAIYNAGEYHAAHDAWEERWLELEDGTDDERFLHGLIQFTAAIYHAHNRNWAGATGLAESALGYLDGLPDPYRDVRLDGVRTYLDVLADDPEVIERRDPPELMWNGTALGLPELEVDAAFLVASVLAEEDDRWDESLVEDAVSYAREELDAAETTFLTLVLDFVGDHENRGLIYQRLVEHVERRKHREEDVDGLFE